MLSRKWFIRPETVNCLPGVPSALPAAVNNNNDSELIQKDLILVILFFKKLSDSCVNGGPGNTVHLFDDVAKPSRTDI